jgi:hypothetical protein
MKLLFVYNATSGLLHGMMDAIHKIASPQTYPCSLCALTYGAVSMDRSWKAWLARLPVPAEFTYRAEFHARYPEMRDTLPAVYVDTGQGLRLLMSSVDILAQSDVNALMASLSMRIEKVEIGFEK